MKSRSFTMAATIFMLVAALPVEAENTAMDRAQYMVRQLNSQKVQLEQQNAELTTELEAIRKETEKQLKQEKAGAKQLDQVNKEKSGQIQELRAKLKDTIIALRTAEAERLQVDQQAIGTEAELKRCVSNNHELVKLNDVLVKNYQDKGFWDSFSQTEPFTGIKQVEIENLMQEYRFQNEDLKVKHEARPDLNQP